SVGAVNQTKRRRPVNQPWSSLSFMNYMITRNRWKRQVGGSQLPDMSAPAEPRALAPQAAGAVDPRQRRGADRRRTYAVPPPITAGGLRGSGPSPRSPS